MYISVAWPDIFSFYIRQEKFSDLNIKGNVYPYKTVYTSCGSHDVIHNMYIQTMVTYLLAL